MKFKKKLISATMSLVVATVLMASSSYAWFTISTNPEISKIKTSITANENIEIALDNGYENAEAIDAASAVVSGTGTAGNPYTWGNLLDMTTAMTNIGANLSLKPVGYSTKTEGSETKVVMKTPQYGLDGRVAKLVDMAQEYISAYDGVTTPSGGISIFKQTEDTDEADALALSFWLRANADVSLMLSEGTYRADDGENTAGTVNAELGNGSTLRLTIPQEAADAAERIRTDVNDYCSQLTYTLNEYYLNYDDVEQAYLYAENWNLICRALNLLLEDNLSESPLQYEIKVVFYDACCTPNYSFSLEEIAEDMGVNDYYINYCECAYIGVECCLRPSEQLRRLLNKIRFRFIVTSEDGQQELMARIVPSVFLRLTGNSADLGYDYHWFNFEGFNFNLFDPESSISFKRIDIEECDAEAIPNIWGEMECSFSLQFYGTDTAGYEDLMDAYRRRINIYNLVNNLELSEDFYSDAVQYLWDLYDVPEESGGEIIDAYIEHVLEKIKEEITDCQKALPHIDLTANEAKKVDLYMYLDGELITNADAATIDGIDLSLNLQFEKIGGATNAMTGRVYVEESESESDEE